MRPWLPPPPLLKCRRAVVLTLFFGLAVPSRGCWFHRRNGEDARPFSMGSLLRLPAVHCGGSWGMDSSRSSSSRRRYPLPTLLESARHKILECLTSTTHDATTFVAAEWPSTERHAHTISSPRRRHDGTTANPWRWIELRGGGQYFIPAGWNPFGYKITALGEAFLKYDGSLDSDVGRFLASLKTTRKRFATLKGQWLEVVRVSKTGQSLRIYKQLSELLQFCLQAGLID